jgi:hypothetical protein
MPIKNVEFMKQIRQIRTMGWLLVILVAASGFGKVKEKEITGKLTNEKGMAILELFTSEGCSSCPPADQLLAAMQAENKELFVLSYHVDYWDGSGWKDPFSQAAFSNRQRQYAQNFHLESIYTPQVVVNGIEEFVGSDKQRMLRSLQGKNLEELKLDVERKDRATLNLSCPLNNKTSSYLQAAFVQPQATTVVKGGENQGRTLTHVNIVRQLVTLETKKPGTIELKIPVALQGTAFKVILFVQQKADMKITAACSRQFPQIDKPGTQP